MNTIEIILLGILAIFVYTAISAPGILSNIFGILSSGTKIADTLLKDAAKGVDFASTGKDPLKYL